MRSDLLKTIIVFNYYCIQVFHLKSVACHFCIDVLNLKIQFLLLKYKNVCKMEVDKLILS